MLLLMQSDDMDCIPCAVATVSRAIVTKQTLSMTFEHSSRKMVLVSGVMVA